MKIYDGRIIYSEPIWIGKRIRDLYQKNATIYILTDDGMLGTVNIDFESLEKNQIEQFTTWGDLCYSDVTTIEIVGGGGIRCLLAELFLKPL